MTTSRPGVAEYAPPSPATSAASPTTKTLQVLASQLDEFLAWLKGIPEARGAYRYAPTKWSIKQVVGHLSDTERVFAYRALRIGRGDTTAPAIRRPGLRARAAGR